MKQTQAASADRPLISIITATYQAASALPFTLESIRRQTCRDFEWIVVDGGSTDGTLELLQAHRDVVTRYVSEPDKGIFDAWNKGVRLARGHWLQFVGAGDELADASTLSQVAPWLAEAYPRHELVYGDIQLISEKGRNPIELIRRPWEQMKGQWEFRRPRLPKHPEVFHHRSIFLSGPGFDATLRFVGDTELMLRSIARRDPLYIPVLVDIMPIGGGATSQHHNLWKIARELRTVNRRLGIKPPLGHRCIEDMKMAIILAVGLLPESAVPWIMDAFRILSGKPRKWRVD